jgi:tetratricopeptide (TPR) repeat protein
MPEAVNINKNPLPPAEVIFKRAVRLFEAGRIAEAAAGFRTALRLDINHAGAWVNLGSALRKLGKLEASASCTRRALSLSPNNPGYLTNYGNCLIDLNRIDEGLEAHAEAARRKPDDFLVQRNYSVALREAGKFEEALALFKALGKERPDDVSVTWEEAVTYLQLGDYKRGWDAFEIRWKLPTMRERQSKTARRWRGEDISGKTLLVYDEQGFGDSILCSRYIPLIKERGGSVIVECKPQLHRLFSAIPGIVRIAETGQVLTGFDYHVPMMSLPGIFGTDDSSIPPPPPLYAAPAPPPHSARLLGAAKDLFKVGIVWSGSETFTNNRRRSVEAARFLPLTEIAGTQFYSLQKGPREKDLSACGAEELILELGPDMNDFSETAAVLKQLDLIIMTDSSVAHLAGSLGVPVWNLLCYRPYWLYLTERQDCPWYPSMRLFRQPSPGDWDSVFKKVAVELEKLVTAQNLSCKGSPLQKKRA